VFNETDNPESGARQEDDPVMQKRRRRAWWGTGLLLFLFLAAPSAFAAPGLVGTWQGSGPGIYGTSCFNDQVTIEIVQQCGNLFRGNANIAGNTTDFVGSIKNETTIYMHGIKAGGLSMFMLFGDYLPGPPRKINVTYLFSNEQLAEEYDAFQASYVGGAQGKDVGAVLYLLLE